MTADLKQLGLVWAGLKRLPGMASVVVASRPSQDEQDERVRGDI